MKKQRIVLPLLTFLFLTTGCKQSGHPVHFILPNGYKGTFKLVIDKKNGVEYKIQNGRYVIRIPKSGILKVKNFDPFYMWHKETASYEDGIPIPDINFGKRNPNSIAFYGLFGNNKEQWWLIGTYHQYLKIWEEPICAEALLPHAKPLPKEWDIDCD